MANYVIDGKNVIPAVAYLGMAWETLAILQTETLANLSVVFEDLTFIRAIPFPDNEEIKITVMVQKGTSRHVA